MSMVKGSKHTPETKRKISKARFGKVRGEKHHNWKGGRKLHVSGYVLIRVDGKYVSEHRTIMEKHLGKILTLEEVIHHKNGIRSDNQIENLELMTKSQHARHHMTGKHSHLGYKHTDETKRRMSESKIGNHNTLGYKHTKETKRRMSESQRKRREKETAGGYQQIG